MGVRSLRLTVLLTFVLSFASLQARAQSPTTGAIAGVVTDENGAGLGGVTVIVSSAGTVAQTAITEGNGSYKITDLTPGDYLVTMYFSETTIERKNVPVGIQKTTPVYQKIDTTKGEVIRVEGKTPAIDPTSTAQGITIDKDYLKNIPVPGRTFDDALGAAAGSQGDGIGVAFSGSSSLENQYYVDGVNTTGLTYGTVGSPIINDFIEEIEIITGGYNAEYGRATGGIVNVVTKTGSNEFKGSIFTYIQPGFFTAAAERTPRNAGSIDIKGDLGYSADVGFELGGPIIKDKLWFYVGFAPAFQRVDYTRETKRQTDCRLLQDDGSLGGCVPSNADTSADLDPETGYYITDTLDTEVRHATSRVYNLLGKINYSATPEQQGQLGISAQPYSSRTPGLYGPAAIGDKDQGLTIDVSAKWTSKFNNGKTEVEASVGIHRDTYENHALDPTLENQPLQLLLQGNLGVWGPGFGETQSTNDGCKDGGPGSNDAYPYITNCPMNSRYYLIGGPGGLADNTVQRQAGRIGVTQRVKAGGTHEIKAGIDFENNQTNFSRAYSGGAQIYNYVGTEIDVYRNVAITDQNSTDPRFDQTCFTPANPIDPDAPTMLKCDYLSGTPGDPGTIVEGNTFNWSAYLRDSWQIKPNLTLNAGIRMEEQRLRYAKFLQGQADPYTGETYGKNALVLRNQFAPRLGLLYDWTREGRSKAYGHWGRFYESIPMAINNFSFGNPVSYEQDYTAALCGTPDPDNNNDGVGDIGGPDGTACVNTSAMADIRQEVYGAGGSIVAPGVKGQYLDEWVAGVEYEVVDDLKLGISLQDRRFGRVIEDVSLDNANTYIVSNPGEFSKEDEEELADKIAMEQDPSRKAKLERQLEMFKGIRIFDKPRRDYTALTFTLVRRFNKNLFTQASYTYSRALGNYPGLVNYDDGVVLPNASTQYDLIELLANRIGPLPQDRPHYIKLDSYYTFDMKKAGQLTAGIRFRALSGTPVNVLGPHYLYGSNQSFLVPRGSYGRSSFEHGLDVQVAYGRKFQVSKHPMTAEVFVDFFNIYNNQGTFGVDESYASIVRQNAPGAGGGTIQAANPVSGGSFEDVIWVKTIDRDGAETGTPIGRNPNFGKVTSRYAPMYARFGARITF